MAYEIGTADDYADLMDRFLTFITTNGDLVSAGEEWTVEWTGDGRLPTYPEDIILKGPGLDGSEQIFVAMRQVPQPDADIYNVYFRGLAGINPNATEWQDHVNVGQIVGIPVGNFSLPYWFIANGRRFIILVRVSTTYHGAYGGFILPYAPPNIWSYPLAVGGTLGDVNVRWSDTRNATRFFYDPGSDNNLRLMRWDNSWISFANMNASGSYDITPVNSTSPWQPNVAYGGGADYISTVLGKMQTTPHGKYPLTPVHLITRDPDAIAGFLDGVYHVPGWNLSAETIVTYDDVDYLCLPNVYRESNHHWAAFALED